LRQTLVYAFEVVDTEYRRVYGQENLHVSRNIEIWRDYSPRVGRLG
jgi:hypothetical protein